MPYTTFHERLMADAVLPTTVRTLLGLSDAEAVYDARRKRSVPQPVEVRIEQAFTENRTPAAGNEVHGHVYELRVRRRAVEGASQSGVELKELAKGDARALVRGLDGEALWSDELGGDVVAIEARERTVDDAPALRGLIESVVDVTIFTLGSGDLEASP